MDTDFDNFFSVPNFWTKIAIFFGSNNNNNNLIPFWDDTEVFFFNWSNFFQFKPEDNIDQCNFFLTPGLW